ncbi:MAG TPA: STAS domain-containing protein [Acidimicrobiales bacterium]|nr:STAS domain-containing protein [Acidimicrobiales bacterium]
MAASGRASEHDERGGAGIAVEVGVAGPAVVHLSGDVDLSQAQALTDRLADLVASGRDVIVDLSGVSFIDSTGMGALVFASRRAEAHGQSVTLRRLGVQVMRTLTLAGLDQVVRVEH